MYSSFGKLRILKGMKSIRGQVEMIGLVIVVVLLVLGGLFYVAAITRDSGNENKGVEATLDASYSNNLLNALYNMKYCEVSFSDVLDLCYSDKILCDKNACDYIKEETNNIIKSVGLEKQRNYSLWLEQGDNKEIFKSQCSSGIKTDIQVASEDKIYTVNLQLC